MGKWRPCKRRDFIKKLKEIGFRPPAIGEAFLSGSVVPDKEHRDSGEVIEKCNCTFSDRIILGP